MSWPMVKLKDVSLLIDYGLTASADVECDGPLFLRITDLGDDGVNWSKVPRCVCDEKRKQRNLLERGDIVFARTGATTGKSYLISDVSEDTVFASYLIRVRTTQKIYSPFLAYFFKSPNYWHQIGGMSSGATLPGVNASKLSELRIPLPPLEEQKRIAAILDKADAIRQKRKQAIELADEFLRSVFLDMFGDPVANPKGWEVKPLKDGISKITSGWSAKGESTPCKPNQLGVLKISAVTSGVFKPEENKYVDDALIPAGKTLLFPKKGDLLFSRANTRELVGATCIVPVDFDNVFLPDKLWNIELLENQLLPEYLHMLLRDAKFKETLTSQATGSSGSMLNISKQKFEATLAPYPSLELQLKFKNIFWGLLDNATQNDSASEQLNYLFNALSQKAFSGQL